MVYPKSGKAFRDLLLHGFVEPPQLRYYWLAHPNMNGIINIQ